MKLAVCVAVLGLVALSLAQENTCPEGFFAKMKAAKDECKTELGIESGPKVGGGGRGGQHAGGKPEGGKAKGGKPEGGQDLAKGGALQFQGAAAGLRKNVAPLVRMVRQITETINNEHNITKRSNENMKKLHECVDRKMTEDNFYVEQKTACKTEAKSTENAEDSQKGQDKCLFRKLKKACGGNENSGRKGKRGENANGGLAVNFKKGAVVANSTSMAVNATQLNVTSPLETTVAQ